MPVVTGSGGSDSLLLSSALGFLDLDGLLERLTDNGQGDAVSPPTARSGPHSAFTSSHCLLDAGAICSEQFTVLGHAPCTALIGSCPTS